MKRQVRQVSTSAPPSYPTLARFDEPESRRLALQRIGAAVLGGLGLGVLAGCGDRALHADAGPPDHRFPVNEGAAPMPDSRIDQQAEHRPSVSDGLAPMPDARVDRLSVPEGAAPMPDARVDGFEADGMIGDGGDPVADGGGSGG